MSTTWIFAYGSLMFRPGFPVEESRRAVLSGYRGRFWQRSPDHRGTAEQPGRVLTLIADEKSQVEGLLLRASDLEASLSYLDGREIAGYERRLMNLQCLGSDDVIEAIVYIADPSNENFSIENKTERLVETILQSEGPSGSNSDYLLRIAEALIENELTDAHIFDLANRISDSAYRGKSNFGLPNQ